MTEDPALRQMRERVRARGRSVAAAVDALGGGIRQATDWRTQAARHPFWALGTCAAIGLLAASLWRRRRGPEARILEAAAGGLEGFAVRLRTLGASHPARNRGLLRSALGVLASRVLRQRLGIVPPARGRAVGLRAD